MTNHNEEEFIKKEYFYTDIFLLEINLSNDQIQNEDYNFNYKTLKNSVPFPLYILGFQHFLHQAKRNFNEHVREKLKDRKQYYEVINPIHNIIDEYDKDLNSLSKSYFNINYNLPQKFYMFWEIFCLFSKKTEIKNNILQMCVHEGSCVKALLLFLEKMEIKNSQQYVFTELINSSRDNDNNIKTYEENYDLIDKTIIGAKNIKIMNKKYHNTCNIEDDDFFESFEKFLNDNENPKFKIIIGNGINYGNPNHIQEQQSLKIIIREILLSLKYIEINGSFILRVLETFTIVMTKLIYIIGSQFNNLYIYKPHTSKKNSTERFIIFIGFKDTNRNKLIKDFTKMSYVEGFLDDIYLDMNIVEKIYFLKKIRYSTTTIGNDTYGLLNRMTTYVLDDNFKGEVYFNSRNEQIENTNLWSSTFFNKSIIKSDLLSENQFKQILKTHETLSQK